MRISGLASCQIKPWYNTIVWSPQIYGGILRVASLCHWEYTRNCSLCMFVLLTWIPSLLPGRN